MARRLSPRPPPERRATIRGYMGHYPYVASQLLGEDPVTLTILRDPVERTISYLKHCKRYHDHHRELSLEEIYRDTSTSPASWRTTRPRSSR